jgi:alpha-ketoglutarate-dependent taurine dioxygenase
MTSLVTSPFGAAEFGCLVKGPLDPTWSGAVRALIDTHGFALLREAGIASNAEFRALGERVTGESIPYRDASTPRSLVDTGVYSATDYPAELDIPPHNEQSYSAVVPRYIAFYCQRPADTGGETVLAESAAWRERISPGTRERFEAAGVLYVRNFYDWLTPGWQTVFATDSRTEATKRCEASGGHCEWTADALRTTQHGPAVIRHPVSGVGLWFNQAHLFHPSRLDVDTRGALEELYEPAAMPRSALYGDGEPIPDEPVAEILDAVERVACDVRLEAGDVLIADNLRIAHGRRAFAGDRRIFVMMSSPWEVIGG